MPLFLTGHHSIGPCAALTSTPCTGKSPGAGRQLIANSHPHRPSSPATTAATAAIPIRRARTRGYMRSAFDVEDADQREKPPRSVEIDVDLALEPLSQQ